MDLASKIEKFARTQYALEELLVFAIRHDGKLYQVISQGQYDSEVAQGHTIKVQSLEKFNLDIADKITRLRIVHGHTGPVTCHAFIAQTDSPSFGWHKDLDTVVLEVLRGEKTIEYMDGEEHVTAALARADSLCIPAETPHCAVNKHASLMLSFGLESYMESKVTF